MRLYSIPSIYGTKCTLFLSKIFHILTILFWLFFVIEAKLGIVAYFAVLIGAVMLYFEHKIISKDFTKIDKAFFTINGYLGVIFFILVVIDRVVANG